MVPWWTLADDLLNGKIEADVLRETGKTIVTDSISNFRRVAGADLSLSNFPRRKGRALKASVVYDRGNDGVSRIKFLPAGLWGLVEGGAKPHRIGNLSNRVVVRTASGKYAYGPFRHGGAGKKGRPAQKALDNVDDHLADELTVELDRRVG